MYTEQKLEKYRADLLWAVTSPDLMVSGNNGLTSFNDSSAHGPLVKWLRENIHNIDLSSLAEKPSKRLGIYFEELWRFIFENNPEFELIDSNLPLFRDKRTLGEFDFIYFCKHRQRYIHMETAVKFYLGIPSEASNTKSTANWENWIGPGARDRLDIKFSRMLSHQCQLSLLPEGKSLLDKMRINAIDREICLKGFFFYPLQKECLAPEHAGNEHLSGFWVKLIDTRRLKELYGQQWIILPKADWFSPVSYFHTSSTMDLATLITFLSERFKTIPFPVMVSPVDSSKNINTDMHAPLRRGFIVPDHWPF